MKKILQIRKDKNGKITEVMLDNWERVDIKTAIQMAKNGRLKDVHVEDANGLEQLVSTSDDKGNNTIENLPTY